MQYRATLCSTFLQESTKKTGSRAQFLAYACRRNQQLTVTTVPEAL
jgi:hypothetical protein